ncbi:MAG: glycoside hydrolase family 5 protein [Chloroflexota bacterium]|nr:glycoside hydrolase family 5 protein [Chloroflexota bacterium]MDQ5867789.1 glycoside hydrolase family 5 protein [Chloroflexota bacterium]
MDKQRIVKLGGVALLLVTSLPAATYLPQGVEAATGTATGTVVAQTKARTNQAADVPPDTTSFANVWNRTDALVASGAVKRSWLWGPQPFWTTRELYVDDPTNTETRLVQYWDKSRMEINNPNGNKSDPFYVTNGLLTVELISGRMQTGNNTFEDRKPAQVNIAGDFDDPTAPTYASFVGKANAGGDRPDANKMGQKVTATIARDGTVGNDPAKANVPGVEVAYYDDVTKHNIPKAMWDFLNASGPVRNGNQTVNEPISSPWFYATGRPISDAYWGKIKIAGRPTDALIQAFERRVLTYVPTNPAGFQVEFGNIGAHYRDWRYLSAGKLNESFLKGQRLGYGFNVQLYYTDKDRVHQVSREAGFNWARQQVAWQDIQGKNLLFAWGELDSVVDSAVRNKQKILLSIAKSPEWAAPKTKHGMPENPLDFGNFMYMLARRYKNKVQAYEIWNEQNLAGEIGGPVSVAPYVELLKHGYTGVKYADPNAIVVFGGLTPTGVTNVNVALDDVEYLKQIYAYQGGVVKNYYDVLGAHPGSNANSPDQLYPENPGTGKCPAKYASQEGTCWRNHPSFYFRRIEQQYAVMAANGEGNKQMWLTEFGWSTYNTALGYEYGQLISPQLQAEYLVRALEKGKNEYPWMGVMFVWNLNFSTLGLSPEDEKVPWAVVNPDWSPRPAFTALKEMQK